MRINTNISSMNAQESASNVNKTLSSSLEKLSSGLRINKAADDSSGMAIADKLRTQASALGQSISNANSGNALVQIADKAMAEQSNILDIVKSKLIQASTSTTSAEGREAIRKDVNKLFTQLDNIASQTNYNGINLLDTKGATFEFQVGEDDSYDISVSTAYAANTAGLGGGADSITSGDNIAVSAGKSVTDTAAITVNGRNGTDTDSAALDIKVSGILGSVTATTTEVTLDLSGESDAIKTAVEALALADADLTYTAATGIAVIGSGDNVDFGDLDFGGAEITQGSTGQIVFNNGTDGAINIQNNSATNEVDLSGAAMTGGDTLNNLKNLAADGLTSTVANSFMSAVDEALSQVNTVRSDFGSTQNQLDSFIRNAMTTQTNIKAAESVIRDVDYAAESANFNKQNIIAQAGTYAMSQANAIQQNIMRLLQ